MCTHQTKITTKRILSLGQTSLSFTGFHSSERYQRGSLQAPSMVFHVCPLLQKDLCFVDTHTKISTQLCPPVLQLGKSKQPPLALSSPGRLLEWPEASMPLPPCLARLVLWLPWRPRHPSSPPFRPPQCLRPWLPLDRPLRSSSRARWGGGRH